jgi:hypothetical protein
MRKNTIQKPCYPLFLIRVHAGPAVLAADPFATAAKDALELRGGKIDYR